MRAAVADALAQWQQNRRLRLAVLAGALLAGFHLVFGLSDSRTAIAAEYLRDRQLLARLEDASQESEWPERARQLRETLEAVRAEVPKAQNRGLAQAELQAWLSERAMQAGLWEPRVRTETTIDVPRIPELWQVIARLDAQADAQSLQSFLGAMAAALPWVQVERLDVTDSGGRFQLSMVTRGYYQHPPSEDTGVEP